MSELAASPEVSSPAAGQPVAERSFASTSLLPIWTLMVRELVRFFRQRTRVIGALGQPVIFWILFGTGLAGSFRVPGVESDVHYQAYFLPGVAAMIVLFTAIFSTISIIEDRREGFLQGVLVSPIPRTSLVLGKICGGAVIAVVQALVFILLAPALYYVGLSPDIPLQLSFGSGVGLLLFLILLSLALTGLGYLIAWPLDSSQAFHAIMSVFLFPMWLLSGAFFPAEGSGWLSWIIRLNPLTYGVSGLRRLMYPPEEIGREPSLLTCVIVTSLFCLACIGASVVLTRRKSD